MTKKEFFKSNDDILKKTLSINNLTWLVGFEDRTHELVTLIHNNIIGHEKSMGNDPVLLFTAMHNFKRERK